jgi:hypothetical protein
MRSRSMASPPSRSFMAARSNPRVRAAVELLATVVGQDLEPRDDDVFRIFQGVAEDRVISTVDPEARHGHKTAARGFDGFKGHVSIDPDSEVILATDVTAGNVGDAVPAPRSLDARRGARHGQIARPLKSPPKSTTTARTAPQRSSSTSETPAPKPIEEDRHLSQRKTRRAPPSERRLRRRRVREKLCDVPTPCTVHRFTRRPRRPDALETRHAIPDGYRSAIRLGNSAIAASGPRSSAGSLT